MIHKKRKGFTIIELIVVIAIIGILVLLASMMFKGHVDKARTARITNDIKATETVMASKLIDDEDFMEHWEDINDTELQKLADAEQGGLYDNEGKIVDTVIPGNYKKIEKEEIKDQLKLDLPGDFYINEKGGELYYYEENVKGNTPTPDETVEAPPLTPAEITDLVENYDFIPVANAKELNQIRPAGRDENYVPIYEELTWGAGTKWEIDCTGTMDSNYVQVDHIDMSDYGKDYDNGEGWQPIGDVTAFTGTYNGANYSISNLFINRPEDYQGLFRSVNNATLNNIVLQDINVTGTRYTGGLVGRAQNSSEITNSYATGSVSGTSYIGGLVGSASSSTIKDSYTTGSVSGSGYVGGLVGSDSSSTITNSHATGPVTGTSHRVGGLVGQANKSTITNSYATDSVTGTRNYVGGLVGYDEKSTIKDSYTTGSVSGSGYVGGLVGSAQSSTVIKNSHATGKITGTGEYTGGLVGYANASSVITDSYATGEVSGADMVGGLVGYSSVEITNSYATGSVIGTIEVGGLVGRTNFATITNSYATGTGSVSGEVGVGGLVGQARSSTIKASYATNSVTGTRNQVGGLVGVASRTEIKNSYATGSVIGTGEFTGGLVGQAHPSSEITNSYATGEVSGADFTGGLAGSASSYSKITNSYATGSVSGADKVGGLAGHTGHSTITNSYATGSVSSTGKYTGGLVGMDEEATITDSYGLTTAQMKEKTNFEGWDFENVWAIDEGSYPYLISNPQSPAPGM